jgi:hypothetical protein
MTAPMRSPPRPSNAAVLALLGLLAVGGCSDEAAGPSEPFVAFTDHFQGFSRWRRVSLGAAPVGGHEEPGQRFVYANGPTPPAGSAWPVGTILVKTVEPSEDPTTWDVIAMVKRGGGYNARGAAGWEYFILAVNRAGQTVIEARGNNPSEPYFSPDAGTAEPQPCNSCHGAAGAAYDHVLTPALRPGAP